MPGRGYTGKVMKNRQEIIKYLYAHLPPRRVAHSIQVEKTARKLARRFGQDENKAALAGLTHDCAKSRSHSLEDMIDMAKRSRFALDEQTIADSPHLLHAPAGETVAREVLGITDDEVLGAICWHTVPRENMSPLEAIVNLADMIEPGRAYPGIRRIREAAKRDLDEAFMLSLARSTGYLMENGLVVHPYTLLEYNRLAAKRRKILREENTNGSTSKNPGR